MQRRDFLGALAGALLLSRAPCALCAPLPRRRVPVICTTDLYHPHQDPGDNLDLITPYGIPEIDLRAIILDVTEKYRRTFDDSGEPRFVNNDGPRDPGVIPVLQLNYLFDRRVPFAVSPFTPLASPRDTKRSAPAFEQSGILLLLETLRRSPTKVHITIFGSARVVAAAFNRSPALLREKVAEIHLSAGAVSPSFLEWNVNLDPQAVVTLLRSNLPVTLYPPAADGPFAYDRSNAFWRLNDLAFIETLDPRLQRYVTYAFAKSSRSDFLHVLEESADPTVLALLRTRAHNVWETYTWMRIAGYELIERPGAGFRLVPKRSVAASDRLLPVRYLNCDVQVQPNGLYAFSPVRRASNFKVMDRGDPAQSEAALREALPELYRTFVTKRAPSEP